MNAREEVAGGFFVTCRDTSKLFDVLKETLDQVSLAIESVVAIAFAFPVRLGWNYRPDVPAVEARDQGVGVITFIAKQGLWRHLGDESFGLGDVVNLSAGEA